MPPFSFVGCLLLVFVTAMRAQQPTDDWQYAAIYQDDSLLIGIRFLPAPDPHLEKWMGLEIINRTARPIALQGMDFVLRGEAYTLDDGRAIDYQGCHLVEGINRLLEGDEGSGKYDFQTLQLAPQDTVFCWRMLSASISADLLRSKYQDRSSMPPKIDRRVEVGVELSWKAGKTTRKVQAPPFSFQWRTVRTSDLPAMARRLEICLDHLNYLYNAPLLNVLLEEPLIASRVPLEKYIGLAQTRQRDYGAQILLSYLAREHPENEALVQYYIQRIEMDSLVDVYHYWSPRLVEPMVQKIEKQGRLGYLVDLAPNYKQWSVLPGLSARLARSVFRYCPYLERDSINIGVNVYRWHSAVQYLTMTYDSSLVIPYFEKLLRYKNVYATYTPWDFSNVPDYWPATRVCDYAFEGICRLRGEDPGKRYFTASGLTETDWYQLSRKYDDPRSLNNAVRMQQIRDQLIGVYLQEHPGL